MEFTDLELALLLGAPITNADDPDSSDLKQNYENLNLKDISYFRDCISDYIEWTDGTVKSKFTKLAIEKDENERRLLLAASHIKAFVVVNYIESTDSFDKEYGNVLQTMTRIQSVSDALDLDGEGVRQNTSFPALLLIASKLLDSVDISACPSAVWWRIRCTFLHQKILEEKSPILYSKMKENHSNTSFQKVLSSHKDLRTLFHCELVDIYLFYFEVESSKRTLATAEESNGLVVNTCGVLGKRTKYQQTALPQLVLKISRVGPATENESFNLLPLNSHPKTCELNDDTRLDKIAVENSSDLSFDRNSLSPLDFVYIFAKFLHIKTSQPKDGLSDEELSAFLSVLSDEPLSWCIKVSSLYYRSILESTHRRTVERSLEQLQVLKDELTSSVLSPAIRYQFFFASRLPTACEIETSMADVLMSLGSTKGALEIYIKYNIWEKVIHCYHKLDLRHRAEEVVRNELEKNETAKLWILLGDATDDTQYYEKAWEFSNHRSGRAQRQWGYYYFHKKEYADAAEHFAKALELNSLEYEVWLSHGYSLMETKKWEECVKAYLYCVNINYDNFEAWNNLAVAYRNLKQGEKALNALLTAAKCDYEVWKVWENILTLAMECNAMDEVLLAYNRLLDLKSNKYVDVTALHFIAHSIINNTLDYKGQKCALQKKKALTLLGRITAAETGNGTVWAIYSDLLLTPNIDERDSSDNQISEETYYRSIQYAEKSIRVFMQKSSWPNVLADAQRIFETIRTLSTKVDDFCKVFPNSSSRAEWSTKINYLINNVKVSIEQSTGRMVDVPKEFADLLQTVTTEQERLKNLSSA